MKYSLCLFALAWAPHICGADLPRMVYRIETVAGSSSMGDGRAATAAQIGKIQGIATDRFGNLYLSDTDHNRVRKIDTKGVIAVFAGTGTAGPGGDGGQAAAAQLNLPYGLAADLAGNLYIADLGNSRVRRVGPDGVIATVAGTGAAGSAGDGGLATGTPLLMPRNVAVDAAGNLYISEFGGHRVRKVTADGKIATVAGTGVAGFRGDGGSAVYAQLAFPAGLTVDRSGALYIADSQNGRVRKVLAGGMMATALGGDPGTRLQTPMAVSMDAAGDIYVADSSPTVRAFTAAGAWVTVAGIGEPGFSGDGGAAVSAQLAAPRDLATDLSGNLYIADGVRIRRVDGSKNIQTVAGDAYLHAIGDGGIATSAILLAPSAILLDGAGNLFIADTGTDRVRQVLPTGTIQTVAGNGNAAPGPDLAPAAGTTLYTPMGVGLDVSGKLLIADTDSHRIRQVGADGLIRTMMGTGQPGVGPELMPPAQTPLDAPQALCFDRAGNLYVADTNNHRILRAATGALVVTAAGNGAAGGAGDGGQARLAQLSQPASCALDSAGNLFIADSGDNRIRKVTAAGVISTVAGTGQPGSTGDEGAATAATITGPRGVAVDDNGDIFIADSGGNRIRQVTPDGVIHTIAGLGAAGFAGDGGPSTAAQLNTPAGLFLDGAGDLYLADSNNNRIRRLVPTGTVQLETAPVEAPLSVVSAASLRAGPVAPGEIATIFGTAIGPASGVAGAIDSTGLLANQLGGSEVRFDGVPAPLFYAQAGQINVQVPYTVAGGQSTHVEVFYQGKSAGAADPPLAEAAPALFDAVANQDGSINSQTNPASRGSIVTFYGTGEGLTDGPNISGQAAAAPYPLPKLPVTLTVGGMQAQILYAGSAPGLIGVLQVNARLSGAFVATGAVAVELSVGTAVAPDLTMWLQ